MTINLQDAAAALSDIDAVVRRVRQSRIYNLASLMLMLWGALVFVGYVATYVQPRYAGYAWIAVYAAGIVGSFVISSLGYKRSGVRTFDVRMLVAMLLFFAFGYLVCRLGHFGPRELSVFWPTYFMLVYTIVGLWLGHAFVAIGLGVAALTLIGYYFAGNWFDLWMAFVNGGGLVLGGLWMRRS